MWDTPVRVHADVITFPTRGPLVEGWLLIVPREHVLSALALDPARRRVLYAETERAVERLRRAYTAAGSLPATREQPDEGACAHAIEGVPAGGRVSVFEHGAGERDSAVGCGVDHVHLHAVQLPFDLAGAARRHPLGRTLTWGSVGGWAALADVLDSGTPYVAIADADKVWYATGDIPSQFFRRVIAAALGHPHVFDWRDEPRADLVHRMLDTFAALEAGDATSATRRRADAYTDIRRGTAEHAGRGPTGSGTTAVIAR